MPEMLDRAAGVQLVEMTLRVALGEAVAVDGPVATERIGYRFFLQPPAGLGDGRRDQRASTQ